MEKFYGCQAIVLNVYEKQVSKKTIYLSKYGHSQILFTNEPENLCSNNEIDCNAVNRNKHGSKANIIARHIAIQIRLDPLLLSCFANEIYNSKHFRNNFYKNVVEGSPFFLITINMNCKKQSRLSYIEADLKWCCHMLPYLTMRLEFEDAFSWLSTLGGAYSSLGDQFHHCASIAGRISQQQFHLACKLGDPFLMSRCHVFLALSLMQRGFLRHAQFILRKQYAFATQQEEITDTRLVAMCKGAWCKLQYLYQIKKQTRKLKEVH